MPTNQQTTDHYIFITSDIEWEPYASGLDVAQSLAMHNVWLISKVTPHKKSYKEGDRALLYVSGRKARYFIGDAVIAGEVTKATDADIALADKLGLEGFNQRIPLREVKIWEEKLLLKPLVMDLNFIKDKKNYGLHLRQAAALISSADFKFLLEKADALALEKSPTLQ